MSNIGNGTTSIRAESPIGLAVAAAAAVLLGLLLLSVPALADPATDAEAAIKNGTELRRRGDDRAALAEFQRAMRIQASPRALAQVGLAEQALGIWLDANTHIGRALETRGDAWIDKHRPTLEQSLQTIQAHLAQVEVWGQPNGAEIRFDGVLVGTLPSATVWVGTGDVSMTVTAAGHAPLTRLLTLPSAGQKREHVQLRVAQAITKLPDPGDKQVRPGDGTTASKDVPGLDPAGSGASSISTPADPAVGVPAPVSPTAERPVYKQWWFWAIVGAAAVGAGAGIYALTRDSSTCGPAPCDTF